MPEGLAGKYEKLNGLNPRDFAGCPCWMTQGSDGRFYGVASEEDWIWDLGLPKPKPSVRALHPDHGAVGSAVIIWGTQLLGATAVSFNGVLAASFTNISGGFVSAVVPAGATTGKVTITTPNGSATSGVAFRVK